MTVWRMQAHETEPGPNRSPAEYMGHLLETTKYQTASAPQAGPSRIAGYGGRAFSPPTLTST